MANKKKQTKPVQEKQREDPPSGEPEDSPSPDWSEFLVLCVAFIAGGGLMSLEIVGGRIVAAHFGSHVFVWGGLIGIFMGALSVGYFFGGRVADKYPRMSLLGGGLLLAGGLVLVVPWIADPVCRIVGNTLFRSSEDLAIRWNPVVAIVFVFTGPAVFLGSITPFTIRLLARDVATMGRITARVYAINALGSIAGTLITAFFLMSVMGNRAILYAVGALLCLVGILVAARGTMTEKVAKGDFASAGKEAVS
ncbi:MAG: fused MFS/spermidine synthase [Planctomycetota bacterium]|jgi:MFS family permease